MDHFRWWLDPDKTSNKKIFRLVNTYNIHIIRFHFWRGFRICARFGLIRHFIGQIHVKPDFNGQIWQKSPKIDDQWHVTPYSFALFEGIIFALFEGNFRIFAQFGLIQSNYRSNIHRTGFYWSEMTKSQQIYELWLNIIVYNRFFLCKQW